MADTRGEAWAHHVRLGHNTGVSRGTRRGGGVLSCWAVLPRAWSLTFRLICSPSNLGFSSSAMGEGAPPTTLWSSSVDRRREGGDSSEWAPAWPLRWLRDCSSEANELNYSTGYGQAWHVLLLRRRKGAADVARVDLMCVAVKRGGRCILGISTADSPGAHAGDSGQQPACRAAARRSTECPDVCATRQRPDIRGRASEATNLRR